MVMLAIWYSSNRLMILSSVVWYFGDCICHSVSAYHWQYFFYCRRWYLSDEKVASDLGISIIVHGLFFID